LVAENVSAGRERRQPAGRASARFEVT